MLSKIKAFEFDVVTLDIKGEVKELRKGQARYFTENVGEAVMKMIEIPGGTFLMGSSNKDLILNPNEGPQHRVTVSPFFMSKYAVTQEQWQAVSSLPKINLDLKDDPSHFKGDYLPVESVNWEEAMEFCNRLSVAKGGTYRLPTEAEWEYACRAGTNTRFAFGEKLTPEIANYHTDGRGSKKNRRRTVAVGSLGVPNGFGLYDMHGNVWEWCMDWYSENYYSQSPSVDPQGPSTGSVRVSRGGGHVNHALHCRSAERLPLAPNIRGFELGFRVVRALR